MAPEFVYPIKDLQNGLQEINAPLSTDWLRAVLSDTELEPAPQPAGEVQVRVSMSGKDVVVRGTVQATVIMECGRCLTRIPVLVQGELSLLLTPAKAAPVAEGKASRAGQASKDRPKKRRGSDAELEFGADDADSDTYTGDEVVLDGFLREAILLELPIFPLCSEECPGIGAVPLQPAQPADQPPSLDPRLAPLLEFQKRK